MKAYKGFDKELKCRGFQFEIGKEYEEKDASLCNKGFHACENPIDVLSYYPPADSRYCDVELDEISEQISGDSKRCAKRIKIGAEIGIKGIVDAFINFTFNKIDWKNAKVSNTGNRSAATNTGYRSAATNTGFMSAATNTGNQSAATNTGDQSALLLIPETGVLLLIPDTRVQPHKHRNLECAATNTGYQSAATNTGNRSAATNTGNWSAATNTGNRSAATNTGDMSAATNTGYQSAATNTGERSAATNTGDQSAATVEGKESIAIVTGYGGKAKGAIGCWIVVTERGEWNGATYPILCVKTAKVDGDTIKENTFYKFVIGEFDED